MHAAALTVLFAIAIVLPAQAQEPLSLDAAVTRARAANPSVVAAGAAADEARARIGEARAGWWPRIDAVESVQRGNLPVYAFSSLLSQRRFSEADFAIASLNHPDPLTNHRAAVSVQQSLFDSGIWAASRTASLGAQAATASARAAGQDIAAQAADAYAAALAAEAEVRAARALVEAADEDLRRAGERRGAGLATDADVLEMTVQQARARAVLIDAESGASVAQATLAQVMGEPPDRRYVLQMPPSAPEAEGDVAALEQEAIGNRPELRQAELQTEIARVEHAGARGALLPQVGWQAGYEWNGDRFGTRAGGWIVGADVRLNLFRGFGDRARVARSIAAVKRADADRDALLASVRLEVRTAVTRVAGARARVEVARSAVAQAREGQRIVRDRYDNGMAGIGDVLRAAQSVLDAERLDAGARAAVVAETARLDRAVGR